MGSLNSAATDTMSLVPTAVMVVIGSLVATILTNVARDNVYDIDMQGGDAVYPILGAFVLNFVLSGRSVQLVSVGMVASSVTTVAKEWGLV